MGLEQGKRLQEEGACRGSDEKSKQQNTHEEGEEILHPPTSWRVRSEKRQRSNSDNLDQSVKVGTSEKRTL